MGRWTKRLLVLALLGGTTFGVTRRRRRRASGALVVAPESSWPPITAPTPVAPLADWIMPADDGSCPDGYPIKANNNSRIYHLPGGRFYDRTKAERCYAEALAAERDGYRRAKA